jgi:hypothetical protein
MVSDEKERVTRDLERLGAVVIESSFFDASCTHLLTGKVGRNEKFMAAMAQGLWILHPSFIVQSVQAGWIV